MKKFKAGNHINQGTYKSFQPDQINQVWTIDNMELLNLLSQADRQLGRLDMYSEYIPNIDLYQFNYIKSLLFCIFKDGKGKIFQDTREHF